MKIEGGDRSSAKEKKSKEKMYQVGVLKVIDSKSINAICGSE